MAAIGSIRRYNVQHGHVRPGDQGDHGPGNDGHVFGDCPSAHAAASAARLGGIVSPGRRLRVRVVVERSVVGAQFQAAGRDVLAAVLSVPERGQMDDGRTEQAQHGEEDGAEQGDDGRQVRDDGGDQDCGQTVLAVVRTGDACGVRLLHVIRIMVARIA